MSSRRPFHGRIRPARPEDLPALEHVLANQPVLASVKDSFAGNGRNYYVAETGDDEVVGMMGLTAQGIAPELVTGQEKAVELVSAYVADEFRGSGAGSALADELEKVAGRQGYDKLIVVSGSRDRGNGYAFWTRRYGEPQFDADYFGHDQERVVWYKRLS